MAPVIFLVMVDLHFTKRAESAGGSFVHEMRIPSVRKARVERREHRASILIRSVAGGKVRVGQGAWITCGRKLRGPAISMPDTTTDPMTMLKVFDPARASLEFVLGNPEDFSDIPGLIADQRVGKRDILRDRSRRQPVNELALDLRELRRPELERTSVLSNSGVDTRNEVPMLSNLELFLSWNVHPLLFVL